MKLNKAELESPGTLCVPGLFRCVCRELGETVKVLRLKTVKAGLTADSYFSSYTFPSLNKM